MLKDILSYGDKTTINNINNAIMGGKSKEEILDVIKGTSEGNKTLKYITTSGID